MPIKDNYYNITHYYDSKFIKIFTYKEMGYSHKNYNCEFIWWFMPEDFGESWLEEKIKKEKSEKYELKRKNELNEIMEKL